MDAAASDAMTTPLGSWASIRGYFTPATLFLVLNLVIGTIALTSRSRDQRRRRHEHLHHDYAAHHHPQAHQYQAETLHDPHQQQQEYQHYYQQEYATPPPAPLARTSSVLDRLRSIGLYRFRSGDFPPEYATAASTHHDAFAPVEEEDATAKQYARSWSEPAPAREQAPPRVRKSGTGVARKVQAARAPAAATRVVVEEAVAEDGEVIDARAEEEFVGGNLMRHEQREPASPPRRAEHIPNYREEAEYAPPPAPMRAPPPLSRTSSVLDRLRSQLGLYSFLAATDQPAVAIPAATPDAFPAAAAAPAVDNKPQATAKNAHYDRSRSEPAAARGQAGNKKEKKQPAAAVPEARMAKSTSSSSATRKPAGPSLVSQQSVNTRAEAFIDSFRKGQSQSQKQPQLHHHDEDEDDGHVAVPPPPAPLARTSSVLDRLRSFSLYLRSGDPVVDEPPVNNSTKAVASSAADEKAKQAAQYSRSRSEPAGKKKAPQAKMSKTSSEAHIAEEAAPAEECVDARADDFINKFRQQLQLQRLNSLLSYGNSTKQQ